MPAAIPLPANLATIEATPAMVRAQAEALMFPVGEPWKHPNARYLDSITWGQYCDQTFHGRMVIVAMSPAISGKIQDNPGLPAGRVGLTRGPRSARRER